MKLIIQIPCFNEADQLPQTLADLPREVEGFDVTEWLVIDDGSTDETVAVARAYGVDHLVRLTNNKGLAAGFQAGVDTALKLGADVIVNTDADNQYQGQDVAKLVRPILDGRADMVIGDREVAEIEHFSALKKTLQRLGSWVVRQASSTSIPDTTSGFRAYNREAAIQMLVVSKFTYTLETIIQAGKLLVAIDHVPIRTNPKTRESRLFPSTGAYVRRNAVSIFRIYAQYEPLRVFWSLALVIGVIAVGVWIRFAIAYAQGNGSGHVQSLILGAVLFIAAVVLWALGVIGDLLAAQRVMTQKTFERVRRIELQLGVAPSHYEPGTRERAVPAPLATGGEAGSGRFARSGPGVDPDGGSPEPERPRVGSAPEAGQARAGSAAEAAGSRVTSAAEAERSGAGSAPDAGRPRVGSAPEAPEAVRL
jgi:glycosyltransferase involved in cell wall biosynthesis